MEQAVPRQLSKWKARISDIMRDADGSWNVGLKPGWICFTSETHQVYESTLTDVVAVFKAGWVQHCDCLECRELSRVTNQRSAR